MAEQSTKVPGFIRTGSDYAWRVLMIGALIYFGAKLFEQLEVLAVPMIAALFLSTLLVPLANFMRRRKVPPVIATWVALLIAIAAIVVIALGLYPDLRSEFDLLKHRIQGGLREVQNWLVNGPLHVKQSQVDQFSHSLSKSISQYQSDIVAGAVAGVSAALEVVAGALLTIVITFFFVKDGPQMTSWFVSLFDPRKEEGLRELSYRLWRVVSGYIRGTAINGLVNALAMSIGLLLLGIPLVAPIAVLTLIGGFLPIAGAFVSGGIAALVALVAKGPLFALGVVLLTVVIHHLEGYIVGPFVLGRALRLHPVAILLSLSAGSLIAGILGAFIAVPITAIIAEVVAFYRKPRSSPVAAGDAPVT